MSGREGGGWVARADTSDAVSGVGQVDRQTVENCLCSPLWGVGVSGVKTALNV